VDDLGFIANDASSISFVNAAREVLVFHLDAVTSKINPFDQASLGTPDDRGHNL
jgi:hypothetical protein